MTLIKNAYNGKVYRGAYKGTIWELLFFRVMPVGGGDNKLYFESEGEYKLWFHRQFQYHPERKFIGIQSLRLRRVT